MLHIAPFEYGLEIRMCYDSGSVFSPEILDITEEDIRAKFMAGVQNIAAVSLAIGYPTVASAPHSIANGFKNLMAIAAATEIEFPQVKAILKLQGRPHIAGPTSPKKSTKSPDFWLNSSLSKSSIEPISPKKCVGV